MAATQEETTRNTGNDTRPSRISPRSTATHRQAVKTPSVLRAFEMAVPQTTIAWSRRWMKSLPA
jgi:hypothetical protein